jgi:hypothetical protein
VSATIEGALWRADPGKAAASFGAATGSSNLVISAMRCSSCPSALTASAPPPPGTPDTLELVRLVVDSFTGPAAYAVSAPGADGRARVSGLVGRSIMIDSGGASIARSDVFWARSGGRIVVTGFDPFARRASGTFAFEMADSAGTVWEVRDGAFDVPLRGEPPPISIRLQSTSP